MEDGGSDPVAHRRNPRFRHVHFDDCSPFMAFVARSGLPRVELLGGEGDTETW